MEAHSKFSSSLYCSCLLKSFGNGICLLLICLFGCLNSSCLMRKFSMPQHNRRSFVSHKGSSPNNCHHQFFLWFFFLISPEGRIRTWNWKHCLILWLLVWRWAAGGRVGGLGSVLSLIRFHHPDAEEVPTAYIWCIIESAEIAVVVNWNFISLCFWYLFESQIPCVVMRNVTAAGLFLIPRHPCVVN